MSDPINITQEEFELSNLKHIAIKAMSALLSNTRFVEDLEALNLDVPTGVTKVSYRIAEEMIAKQNTYVTYKKK